MCRRSAAKLTLPLLCLLCVVCVPLPINADTVKIVYMPTGTDSAQNPAFSPGGNVLVFTLFHNHYNTGDAGIYKLAVSGIGKPVVIHDTLMNNQSVNEPGRCWNGVTNRITFTSDDFNGDDIYTIAPNGSNFFDVTRNTSINIHYFEPSFSPNGKQIVFEDATHTRHTLWKINSDGSGKRKIVDATAFGFSDREPNWSPLGDRIVFQRHSPNGIVVNIYTVRPDGTGLVQVTSNTDGEATDASWSPNGKWIVYSGDSNGNLTQSNLFITTPDHAATVRVTHNASRYDGAPSWSPDGKSIVYESSNGAPDFPNSTEIRQIAVPALPTVTPTKTPRATATPARSPIRTPAPAKTRTPVPTRTPTHIPTRTATRTPRPARTS
jgi:TolB protein